MFKIICRGGLGHDWVKKPIIHNVPFLVMLKPKGLDL
jgi:hypothetical protein